MLQEFPRYWGLLNSIRLATPRGFEPPISSVTGSYSILQSSLRVELGISIPQSNAGLLPTLHLL